MPLPKVAVPEETKLRDGISCAMHKIEPHFAGLPGDTADALIP